MPLDLDDTIVAVASAPGGAVRGIVRLSGPSSAACVARVFTANVLESGVLDANHVSSGERQCPSQTPDPLAIAHPSVFRGELTLPRNLGTMPAQLYLWPDRRSYTRQPAAELHTTGSPPLLEAVIESLCQAGARQARPGEFTLRAFLAGRLDLTQAEAVLGVIDARGQAQLDTALAQLAGGLAGPLAALRERLLVLVAHLEAGLDFVDEDIEFITPAELDAELAAAAGDVDQLVQRMRWRREASELPRVVLVGPPNAGKSSLLNALVGSGAAIVSETAGTTRDYVTCRVTAGGQEFLLVDTAGVECAGEAATVEQLARFSTEQQRRDADVTISCRDASGENATAVSSAIRGAHVPYDAATHSEPEIDVWTKCDLASPPASQPGLATSSKTGRGIAELGQAICRRLAQRPADAALGQTAARCGESLDLAAAALKRAREVAQTGAGDELVAAEVRTALDGLGQVAGTVYTDDVLDRVFSRFCIGK